MVKDKLYLEFLFQVCIDVIVQRLGDAAAAGIYKLLFGNLNSRASMVSLYALPVCLILLTIDILESKLK